MNDLTEQAQVALDILLDDFPATVSSIIRDSDDAATVARLMWLDGYKAGMDATKAALATVLS